MITKVLIAEDHQSVNTALRSALNEFGVKDIDYAYYCDDALKQIQISKSGGQPYDLLITDLNFENDGTKQKIESGVELIQSCRSMLPELMVLVFSVESRPVVIQPLYEIHQIDGYIRKSRTDGRELTSALEALSRNERYLPRHLSQSFIRKNSYQFTEYDIEIITLLASGESQKNIPSILAAKKIRPSSLSSMEKRLNHIKAELEFTKNEQLVAFCKDMGVI